MQGKHVVCVFGASGSVGSSAADELEKNGYQVRLAYRKERKPLWMENSKYEAYQVDLDDEEQIRQFCMGADLIIGAAGPSMKYSERMQKAAIDCNVPYVDPGGMHLLKNRNHASNVSVVGAGVFPGLSGWMLLSGINELGRKNVSVELSVGGRYAFTNGAALDFVEESKGMKSGVPMACIHDRKIAPAKRMAPVHLPDSIKEYRCMPYITEEVLKIAQDRQIEYVDGFTLVTPEVFQLISRYDLDPKRLVKESAEKNENYQTVIYNWIQKEEEYLEQKFTGGEPGNITGRILALTAMHTLQSKLDLGCYTMPEVMEHVNVVEKLRTMACFEYTRKSSC